MKLLNNSPFSSFLKIICWTQIAFTSTRDSKKTVQHVIIPASGFYLIDINLIVYSLFYSHIWIVLIYC